MANMTTRTIDGVTYWLLSITGANNPSGYAEKLLTASTFVDKNILVSVPSATETISATYETLNAAGASPTSVTSQYFKITPTATVSVAGWIDEAPSTNATYLGSVVGSNRVIPNSETFTCTSGYLCLESYESLTYTGDQQVGGVTLHYGTTGGVTFVSETQDSFPTIVVYRVTDDGTITAASYS